MICTLLYVFAYLNFFGVRFLCILPLSQKFHEPEGFTVLGFKLFHEIPIYSVLSKLDDDEAHKGAQGDSAIIWFHLLKIISWLQLLRKTTCFQINCRHPCYFHAPQKPSECLWGTGDNKASLPPELRVLLSQHLCCRLCFLCIKLLPAVPTKAELTAVTVCRSLWWRQQ